MQGFDSPPDLRVILFCYFIVVFLKSLLSTECYNLPVSKENPNFLRKTEPLAEKAGGGLLVLLGAISFDAPMIAAGVILFFLGKTREIKS